MYNGIGSDDQSFVFKIDQATATGSRRSRCWIVLRRCQ